MARASSPETSLIALSIFSLCLSAAVLGTSGHVLQTYRTQQSTNLWWLPVWRSHFDARGLETLIGASVSLVVLNLVLCCTTFFLKAAFTRFIILGLATVAAVAALVEIAYPAAITNAAPGTDSMQTWTCQWAGTDGSPSNFSILCHESRFAYFASIPVFVAQLLVLGLAVQNLFVSRGDGRIAAEKGEELGFIMAPESLAAPGSGKASPEMHVYGRGSP